MSEYHFKNIENLNKLIEQLDLHKIYKIVADLHTLNCYKLVEIETGMHHAYGSLENLNYYIDGFMAGKRYVNYTNSLI
jgi:hypothetical protein